MPQSRMSHDQRANLNHLARTGALRKHPVHPVFTQTAISMRSTMKNYAFAFYFTLSVATLFAAESAGPTLAQGQARLLRHPTYSKGKIAFSYLGDIWIAKEDGSDVRRLTD